MGYIIIILVAYLILAYVIPSIMLLVALSPVLFIVYIITSISNGNDVTEVLLIVFFTWFFGFFIHGIAKEHRLIKKEERRQKFLQKNGIE